MKNEEEKLFSEWRKKHKNFISDGVVDEGEFVRNEIKVLYILKEVNGGYNWDLRKFLNEGGRFQTWNNISRWHYGIENYHKNNVWNEAKRVNKRFRTQQLRRIAAINLKKEPGKETSDMKVIRNFAWKDRDFLKQQINIYKPKIIVCCGTGEIVKDYKLVGNEYFKAWKISSTGIEYHITKEGVWVIKHCHPQSRGTDREKFVPLIQTLLELKSNKPETLKASHDE